MQVPGLIRSPSPCTLYKKYTNKTKIKTMTFKNKKIYSSINLYAKFLSIMDEI